MSTLTVEQKRALLRERLRQSLGETGTSQPLSYNQEALWFLWKLAPQSGAYNIAFTVRVRGELDVPLLERCWHALVLRHASLRTHFGEEEGEPRQTIAQTPAAPLEQLDGTNWTAEETETRLYALAHRPFELEAKPAPRFTLIRQGSDAHLLLLVVHHIMADLWSLTVVIDELRELYEAEKKGAACRLPPVRVSYDDYSRWHRQQIDGEHGAKLWAFWEKELAGDLPQLDLPLDFSRPSERSFLGGMVFQPFDAALTGRLKTLAARESATLFMLLLSAYEIFLQRYTGQHDFVVGVPSLGRQRTEFDLVAGDFVNLLPLRADLAGDPAFRELLGRVRTRLAGAIQHQEYPFSLLVKRLQRNPDLSRAPIFQTSFVLQKFHRFPELARTMLPAADEPTIPFADLVLEPLPLPQQDGQYDLHLELKEDGRGQLMAGWKYDRALLKEATVRRMSEHFDTLLRAIAEAPQHRVSELSLMTKAQARTAITSGRAALVELPVTTSVVALFEAQAARTPEAVAVHADGVDLTYAALAQRVTSYASGLAELGVAREDLVALMLPRGADFIATMLAISKVGGAFLPLVPQHPPTRTGKAIVSGRVRLVITTAALHPEVSANLRAAGAEAGVRVIATGELASERPTAWPALLGENLAYVMYTSGSTGVPKGAMVEHRGMVNHVLAKLADLNATEADVVAQTGPQSFDIVVWQCLAPLVIGAKVVVLPDGIAEDPAALLAAIDCEGITIVQLVPSMLNAVLDEAGAALDGPPALRSLRWMVPTGDALPTGLCRRWLKLYPRIPLLNTYGSTECSDDQCHYVLPALGAEDEAVLVASVGQPIQNMTAYVLDANLEPVPVGVVGELYIGGLGVGRGYRHDPALTAAAFIPDPFSAVPGARLYRTRDQVRRRSDGHIDFLGRIDQMIKMHGFRIEPREIEAALCEEPGIAQAAVLLRNDPAGDRRIVAYVVQTCVVASSLEEIRRRVAGRLPSYMVPTVLCPLEALPMNSSGKLDRARLPEPPWRDLAPGLYVAPRTPAEEKMAAIWAEVLRLERVGVTDDFFAIGGDSIRTIQIVARARRAGLHVEAADLFRHRTVAGLCSVAAASVASVQVAAPQVSAEHLQTALAQVEFDCDEVSEAAEMADS